MNLSFTGVGISGKKFCLCATFSGEISAGEDKRWKIVIVNRDQDELRNPYKRSKTQNEKEKRKKTRVMMQAYILTQKV